MHYFWYNRAQLGTAAGAPSRDLSDHVSYLISLMCFTSLHVMQSFRHSWMKKHDAQITQYSVSLSQ